MNDFRRKYLALLVPACVMVSMCACREEPPAEPHNTNLGTSDQYLMPTVLPQFDDSVMNGRATLVPLQDLSAARAAADNEAAARATLEKYQTAFRANDFDTMTKLTVERQREIAAATADLEKEMLERIREVVNALKESMPMLYQAMGGQLESLLNLDLDLDQLTVDGDTATLPLPMPGAPPMQLEKTDGEWFLVRNELPADKDAAVQQMQSMNQAFQTALDVLQDSSLSDQERAQRVAAAFASMAPGAGASQQPPSPQN